jgi:hypothetical protein
MATPNSLVPKLRNLLQDNTKPRFYTRSFLGSRVFILEDSNIDESTIVIEKNGVEWDSDNYSYNSITGKLTIHEVTGEELTSGVDTLGFYYSCYEKYSDSELESYIKNSIYYLSIFDYETFTLGTGEEISPEPEEVQENLIVIVAAILAKGTIKSYKTPEFTIVFGDNLSIEDKIQKLVDNFSPAYGTFEYIDLTESAAEED